MATGLLTPLQLTAASALLNNQGIKGLPSTLTAAITAFNATTVVSAYLAALNYYVSQSWTNAATLNNLQTIGNTNCPALGNSIPVDYTNLDPVINPGGFSGLIVQTGNSYLGNGDVSKFVQGFFGTQNYVTNTNLFINSAVNAQSYLGPTFVNMNSLVTNNISELNTNLTGFATDLWNQGKLTNLQLLPLYGTPAALLAQIALIARIPNSTLKVVETALLVKGLTVDDIATLISGQSSVSENQFNQLQKLAYQGMKEVTGDDLQQVLQILDVSTPNIVTMADLLDPKMVYPNSYQTLQTPTPNGFVPVYLADGSVNMNLMNNVNAYLPTPTGCEDLGKIIPPDQAVANKSIQVAYEQVTNITNTDLPNLAQTIRGVSENPWNNQRSYFANDTVYFGSPMPTTYRAQQDVPPGIDIGNTQYWLPASLGGLSTMAGLPAIESLTQPIPQSVIDYWLAFATGSGPNGTITLCDIIGLAIDYNNFAAQLTIATTVLNSMPGSADLTALLTAYADMLTASDNVTMQTYIDAANAAIANIANSGLNPGYVSAVSQLNSTFDFMANVMSNEKSYQTAAGFDYNEIIGANKASILSFVFALPGFGTATEAGGSSYFLHQVANTTVLGGQAIVGVMREATNNVRLDTGLLSLNVTAPFEPPVTPIPVVVPVTGLP